MVKVSIENSKATHMASRTIMRGSMGMRTPIKALACAALQTHVTTSGSRQAIKPSSSQ